MLIGVAVYFLIEFVSIYMIELGFIKFKAKKANQTYPKLDLKELTVIIPFRNEANNLPQLIQSIAVQQELPKLILFVDDHSEDLFDFSQFNLPFNFQCITLLDQEYGKKKAIRKGVLSSDSTYVLTLDADVILPPTYFQKLGQTEVADLTILPVWMNAKKIIGRFFQLDYAFSHGMNTAISGFSRNIICSGANLLFNRELFLKVDSYEIHKNIASGDDQYLLNDFNSNQYSVISVLDSELMVETHAPEILFLALKQRIRWIGKTTGIKDQLMTGVALFSALIQFFFLILLIVGILKGEFLLIGFLLGVKLICENIVFRSYFKELGKIKALNYTWLISIFYPIYIFSILVLMKVWKPKWKGRK